MTELRSLDPLHVRRARLHGAWLAALLSACTASELPAADNGSSETHFLRRCTTSCGGGLTCMCGVCSQPCASDEACQALADRAVCLAPSRASCGGRASPDACELACAGDDECSALGDEHRCMGGVCRAGTASAAGTGGGGAPAGSGGGGAGNAGTPAAGGTGGSTGVAGVACGAATCGADERCCDPCTGACVPRNSRIACVADQGAPVTCDGGVQGQPCGDGVCGPSQSCCDRCRSLCIPATSGAVCPDDTDPNRVCTDAGTPQGEACGSLTCGADERCCDACQSACVSATSMVPCPADSDVPQTCSDAGTGMCGAAGESCLTNPCCAGLSCCSGIPVPAGQANCYVNDCPDSDQNLKRDIVSADTDAILSAVATLPIARWRYTDDPAAAPHVGPMAQDFQAAFAVGGDDRHIAKVDGDGVSLAAIQALYRRVQQLEGAQRELAAQNAALERELEALRPAAPDQR